MAVTLTIIMGDDKGRQIVFDIPDIRVGRNPDNDLVVKDTGSSRYHFRIIEDGGAYIVRDLKSSNGTKLNGVSITEAQISDGDVITVGKTEIRFSPAVQPGARKAAEAAKQGGFSPAVEGPTNPEKLPAKKKAGEHQDGKPAPAPRKPAPRIENSTGGAAPSARPKPAARPNPLPTGRPKPAPRVLSGREDVAQDERPQDRQDPEGETQSPEILAMVRTGAGVRMVQAQAVPPTEDFRTLKPSGGLAAKFRAMPRPMRILIVGLSGLIFLFLVVGILKKLKTEVATITDQSETLFKVDAKGDERVFGYGPEVDVLCTDKVKFAFNYGNGRMTIYYDVIGVEYKNEIEVKINGIAIANAPLSIDNWEKSVMVDVPRKHLMQNSQNEIVFDNTKNPPEKQTWAVSDVRVIEDPLPQPDDEKARTKFELGKKTYEAKDVSLSNRFKAWSYFKDARDYLELLDHKPDIYYEAVDAIKRVQEELHQKYSQMLFDAQKALQYNKPDEAVNILRNIMKLFPDLEDPHYKAAQENIEAIEE